MSVKIRLRRIGKHVKGRRHFRIAIMSIHTGRDSRCLEEIGYYNPKGKLLHIKKERYDYWVSKGALPSATVKSLVKKTSK